MTPVLGRGAGGRARCVATGIRRAPCVAAIAFAAVVTPAYAGSIGVASGPNDPRAVSFGLEGYAFEVEGDVLLNYDLDGSLWHFGGEASPSMLFGASLVQPIALTAAGVGAAAPAVDLDVDSVIMALPEPAMVTLLFTGLAALISALRRRSGARTAQKALPEPQTSAG